MCCLGRKEHFPHRVSGSGEAVGVIGVKCVVILVLRMRTPLVGLGRGVELLSLGKLPLRKLLAFRIGSGKLFTCDWGSLVCPWGSPRRVWAQRVSQDESGLRREFYFF